MNNTNTNTNNNNNTNTDAGPNFSEFAGFGSPPASDSGSYAGSSAGATSTFNPDDDPEVQKLLVQLRILELRQKIAGMATAAPKAAMVEADDGLLRPKEKKESAAFVDAVDARTGKPRTLPRLQVNFRMAPEKYAKITKRFPGVYFAQPEYGSHDHPMAHIETMLATRELQRTLAPGTKILDLFGNPAANERFNKDGAKRHNPKVVDTMVSVTTAKDELRKAKKWGKRYADDGTERYWEVTKPFREMLDCNEDMAKLAAYDAYISINSLYYLKREEIVALLNAPSCGRKMLTAVIHRHKYSHAPYFMWDGEVRVDCSPQVDDGDFVVTQTNVETNESYMHLSMEWLWRSASKVWISHTGQAMTWDLKKFTDETWIVTFIATDPNLDEGYRNRARATSERTAAAGANRQAVELEPKANLPVQFPIGRVTHVRGLVMVAVPGIDREFKISNPEFYDMLRKHVSGKERDDKLYKNLVATAARETDKNNNYPGSKKYDVAPEDVNDHVVAAFIADVARERLNMSTIAVYGPIFKEHTRLFKGATKAVATSSLGNTADMVATGAASALRIAGKGFLANLADSLAN